MPTKAIIGSRVHPSGRFVATSLWLLSAFTIAACSTAPAPRQADRRTPDTEFSIPAPTERVTVQVGDIGRQTSIDGRVIPRDATTVVSPLSGTIASLDVVQGDEVRIGDVIATIELDDDTTRAILDHQLAVARRALADGGATGLDPEAADPEPADQEALDARVAETAAVLIDLGLDPEAIGSSDDAAGLVSVIAERDGSVVSTSTRFGEPVGAGSPIVLVGDPTDLIASGTASPSQLELVDVGAKVDVVAPSEIETPSTGTVAAIIDGSAGQTSSGATVEVQLDDPDRFEVGTRVTIIVGLESAVDVMWLPPSAIRGTDDERFVLVERDGEQERIDVELGLRTDARVEILTPEAPAAEDTTPESGSTERAQLRPGDQVVTP